MGIFAMEVVRETVVNEEQIELESMCFRRDAATALAKKAWGEVKRFRKEIDCLCKRGRGRGRMLKRETEQLCATRFLKGAVASIALKAQADATQLCKEINCQKARAGAERGDE